MPKLGKHESHALGGFILRQPKAGTPVNAVAPKAILTFDGVVVHGETVIIGDDVYQFAADEAQTVDAGAIAVDITSYAAKASQTLTVAVNPTKDVDTMVIGVAGKTTTYTFRATADMAEDTDIEIGTNVAATQANIVAKLNERTDITCSAFETNVATLTAVIGGTAGNSITCTGTFADVGNLFGGAKLANGDDCTQTEAKTALLALDGEGTEPVALTAGAVGQSIVFTATTKGTLYETIVVDVNAANGAFDVEHLDGGVDGTIGQKSDLYADNTYLYICIADNGISGTNWRRIALGNVY